MCVCVHVREQVRLRLCAHVGGERWEMRAGRQVRRTLGCWAEQISGRQDGPRVPRAPCCSPQGTKAEQARGGPTGVQRVWRPGDGEASVRETLSCVIYLSWTLGSLAQACVDP